MPVWLQILSWVILLASALICSGDTDVSGGFGDLEISPTRLTRIEYRGIYLPVWEHRQNSERQPEMPVSLQVLSLVTLLASALICSGDTDVSGGFGDLEISPTRLTRIEYRGIYLPVWEHRQNSERQPGQKQYFTLPLVSIRPNSASCIHNVLTNAINLHVNVVMWTDQVDAAMISKLRSFTNIGLNADQVSIIPMERIRFVWKSNLMALSDQFLLDDAWHSYALKTKSVRVSINTDSMASCEKLQRNINSQPEVLNSLELQFILQAKKSFQTKIRIKGEHIGKSLLVGQMRNLAEDSGWILLQPSDLSAVCREVVSNLIAERETDAGYVDSGDQLSISKQLQNALAINRVSSGDISVSDWSRLYWHPAKTRPDLITGTLNNVFKKSNKGANDIVINTMEYEQMVSDLPATTNIRKWSRVPNGSIIDESELKRWLLENDIKSQWNGNRFTISSIKLYRIYISKLTSRQDIIVKDVQVHSNEHVYSLKPTIPKIPKAENATTVAVVSKSAVNYKITKLDERFNDIDAKLDKLEEPLGDLRGTLDDYDKKFGKLQASVDAVTSDLSDPLRKLRENDRIAQAICSTMSGSYIFAVRRQCSNDLAVEAIDCNTWCTRQPFAGSDLQGTKRGCAGSIHVYAEQNNLPRNHTELLNGHIGAYKVFNYRKQCGGGCGPNYCCCTAV